MAGTSRKWSARCGLRWSRRYGAWPHHPTAGGMSYQRRGGRAASPPAVWVLS